MLVLTLRDTKGRYDPVNKDIIYKEPVTVHMEHSLLSISKWEAKWHKIFLDPYDQDRPMTQLIDYYRCMIIDGTDPSCLSMLTEKDIKIISDYITTYQGGTTMPKDRSGKTAKKTGSRISSESIYCMMLEIGMDWRAETWHLTRLLKVIEIYTLHNKKDNKVSKQDQLKDYAAINAARRKKLYG